MGIVAGSLVGLMTLALLGCDAPITAPAERHQQSFQKQLKSRADYLFVIGNSSSMCEAQDTLARSFDQLTDKLLDRWADVHVAVISTDMIDPNQSGGFLSRPAPPVAVPGCQVVPNTADCPPDLPAIISVEALRRQCSGDEDCLRASLAQQFRCHAILGTASHSPGAGLTAMRTALSCDGPNHAAFAQRCEGGRYDPTSAPAQGSCQGCADGQPCPDGEGCVEGLCERSEPEFLRPDALLVVVFVTDEDDHSGEHSSDYFRFLVGLKASPSAQIMVVTVVGPCESPGGGAARGLRYLWLSEVFGRNGIKCDEGTEGTEECVTVCAESFLAPLQRSLWRGCGLRGGLCVERPPLCQIHADHGSRPCETEAQRGDPKNYVVEVSIQHPEDRGRQCPAFNAPLVLPRTDWRLILGEQICSSGAEIRLKDPLPPGAKLLIEYEVDTAREAAN